MSERDYIQQPVDVGYEQGIQQMGRGKRASAAEWFEAIARTMAMGLAMRGGVGNLWRYPTLKETPGVYQSLGKNMAKGGGSSSELPLGTTTPLDAEQLRTLRPNVLPRSGLEPVPPPLKQPIEAQPYVGELPGGPLRPGVEDPFLFLNLIQRLYRRGVVPP